MTISSPRAHQGTAGRAARLLTALIVQNMCRPSPSSPSPVVFGRARGQFFFCYVRTQTYIRTYVRRGAALSMAFVAKLSTCLSGAQTTDSAHRPKHVSTVVAVAVAVVFGKEQRAMCASSGHARAETVRSFDHSALIRTYVRTYVFWFLFFAFAFFFASGGFSSMSVSSSSWSVHACARNRQQRASDMC